jgi:Acetyltransferase (GNAT) domain
VNAELLADRGAAAESEDFFRSRAFFDAEAVTHTLRIDAAGGAIAVPLLVRGISGTNFRDGISPYGYPGGRIDGATPPDPAEVEWGATGLVSVFIRERLDRPCLQGATSRSVVQVSDPGSPRRLRTSTRQEVERNQELGYRVERLPGPEADVEAVAGFERAYEQTMRRAGAAGRYLFGSEYFEALLGSPAVSLFVAHGPGGGIAAGAIGALSDGLLHYFLSGSGDEHATSSPTKNVVVAMIDFADELGVPVNLGGGVRPGDGLEAFKKGFANSELPFHTHEVVCDPAAYAELSAGREGTDFFPLYRAPSP